MVNKEEKEAALKFFKHNNLKAQHGRWVFDKKSKEIHCLPMWVIRRMNGSAEAVETFGGWTVVFGTLKTGKPFPSSFSVCKSGDPFSRTNGIYYAIKNSSAWDSALLMVEAR